MQNLSHWRDHACFHCSGTMVHDIDRLNSAVNDLDARGRSILKNQDWRPSIPAEVWIF